MFEIWFHYFLSGGGVAIVAQFRVVAVSNHSFELSNGYAESKPERTFSIYFAITSTNSHKFESWANFCLDHPVHISTTSPQGERYLYSDMLGSEMRAEFFF